MKTTMYVLLAIYIACCGAMWIAENTGEQFPAPHSDAPKDFVPARV